MRRLDSNSGCHPVAAGLPGTTDGFRVTHQIEERSKVASEIAGFVDVFNLLNANPEQTTSWSSGTFLRPLSIAPPRIARVGMKLDW